VRIKIESEFLPLPRFSCNPLGRAQTTTHHKVIRLTANFLSGGKMKIKIHKLFLTLSFLLLFITRVFGQAAVDIPLLVTEGTDTRQVNLGLDLTATNGIDPQLGESNLPGPPPGWFDARFDLYPYTGNPWSTYKDYRAPGIPPTFPFTGIIEHTLWWTFSGASLDITYNLPFGAIMNITDQIGGTFLNLGPFSGQGTVTIPSIYTQIFQRALLIMQYDDIIPVEFTSFTASVLQNEKAVQLNWTTATETNNSGFEIERLQDSKIGRLKDWEKIGFVPGFGTTTDPKSYSFTDDLSLTPNLTHTFRYRLKQIDFDGTFTYSQEIVVAVDFSPKEFVLYQNYQNPFNPSTTIKYALPVESQVRINVYNALGEIIEELVSKVQSSGNYEVTWNAKDYSSGIYYYSFEVTSADGSQSHREMKKIVFLK
jgi:hypothetical protein